MGPEAAYNAQNCLPISLFNENVYRWDNVYLILHTNVPIIYL